MRQDVWSKRTWEASPEELQARKDAAEAAKPTVNTPEQAKELEKQILEKNPVTKLTPEQAKAIDEQSKATVNTPEQAKELEDKILDKSGENDIINPDRNRIQISMQHFAKKVEDFETIFLPKDEYAHVMSEIASNLTEEQVSKRVIKKHIGDYIYTVENKGFGNYRVIGKDLIE